MTVQQISIFFESWAPKFIQWERDNTGLLVGSGRQEVTGVLLCFDVTEDALERAQKLKCNLIISHHPLIFFPLKKITPDSGRTSKLIYKLIQNNLTLLSYHTNLDFTHDGVNHQLAKKLNLSNLSYLKPVSGKSMKLVVFVPENDVDAVSAAIFSAGGGVIGEYTNCSFTSAGTGSFVGSENSNPSVGQKSAFEKVKEIRLEVLVNEGNVKKVVHAMKSVHSYEEPAYDIYPLKNDETRYGMGVIGTLPKEMKGTTFLEHVATALGCKALRHSKVSDKKIKKVAVFGGSASEYWEDAAAARCDAFVTADIKYHTFQDAEDDILIVDAGHFETEVPVLQEMKKKLDDFLVKENEDIKVFIYDGDENPVHYFNF